jgi:hypothetical protein
MNAPEQAPLPPSWQARVREELGPGEELVWAAQPLPVSAGRTALEAWPWVLFGVFWLGLTAFGYFMWQSHKRSLQEFDAATKWKEHFQDDFFREERERRRKEEEEVKVSDVMPLILGGVAGLVGVVLLLSPLWLTLSRKRRQARSCYALTTRRALVWEPGGSGSCLHSYEPHRLDALQRVERDDGSGDLVFEEYTYTYQANVAPAGAQPSYETRVGIGQRGFLNVARVRQVERLLRQTLLR